MIGVNQVIILGNLGVDPEIRVMPDGDIIATLNIATSRIWKDKAGKQNSTTEWHRITLYRRLAEIAKNFLKKGNKVFISGYLQTKKWTDDNGIERWTTSIIAERLQLLDKIDQTSHQKNTSENIESLN
ncbi:single-stranded DNA-binding protein [Gallibacterium genomosp. 2]|uniref:single-stranded DNA-binding protein n=1 Tax=Gallibacterium genomosp. 2 TaxID=155517 RepID=UPI00068C384A|nr:single-stranded DNA-binding protein [Gallibacterium genomosp. 2]